MARIKKSTSIAVVEIFVSRQNTTIEFIKME
jgi:hypothetical protein